LRYSGLLEQAGAEFGGMTTDSEFAHDIFEGEADYEWMRHQCQAADNLGFAFDSREIDHAAARGKDAIIRAVSLKHMAGQVVVFMPAGNYLFSGRQCRVDENERGIILEECAAV